ncbi:hypothetical protein AcW2_005127 [Taiwanofungus camphoratus]|nr:hypothetical protein AcW2_005127 [Antrodia cinnamomea]
MLLLYDMDFSLPNLPPEICDYILDYLWDDPRTLRACSLTCRAWLPTTRLHLFHSMHLSEPEQRRRVETLLKGRSNTGEYIRRPSVANLNVCGIELDQMLRLRKVEHLALSSSGLRFHELIARLDSLYAAVKSFDLDGDPYHKP